MADNFGPIASEKVETQSGVVVYNINTLQSKDTLDRLIGDPDPLKWQTFAGIGDDFASQMTAEHKVADPKTKLLSWVKKTSGAANHYWDLSANSCAIAVRSGASAPKPPAAPQDEIQYAKDQPCNWVTSHKGRW